MTAQERLNRNASENLKRSGLKTSSVTRSSNNRTSSTSNINRAIDSNKSTTVRKARTERPVAMRAVRRTDRTREISRSKGSDLANISTANREAERMARNNVTALQVGVYK